MNFYSEPQIATYKTGQSAVVCFEDPDGTVLEMVQFQKTASAPPRNVQPHPEGLLHLVSIYHININCTDFDRSLEFYKMLGFREVVDMSGGEPPADAVENVIGSKVLRVPDARGGRSLILGVGNRSTLQPYRPDPVGYAARGRAAVRTPEPLRDRARLLL